MILSAATVLAASVSAQMVDEGAASGYGFPSATGNPGVDCVLSVMRETSPLPDRVNTPPEVWIEAAAATLAARVEMPWGRSVPAREWEHFVVPLRVNNEPIDGSRPVIYNELRSRVKNMTMEQAALEVNHWCHEYARYQPSDGRTHSPLQTMSSHIGRCGEESTFTVAALRAVGIPARQVYTPRWAHTDDNHAWVEVWIDGRWRFLGACEPEPVLDMAWFNAPATRGMMMHTFVRGSYDGPEEVVSRNADGVNINVTATYAPVVNTTVTVKDDSGRPVDGAKVTFRVYNYAEYYPIATKTTDDQGRASALSGIGDMIVWATDGSRYGFTKLRAGDGDANVTLTYGSSVCPTAHDFNLVPPAQGDNPAHATDEARRVNNCRLAYEDSLRQARMDAEFASEAQIDSIARQLGLDRGRVDGVMKKSRGNWAALSRFLDNKSCVADRARALLLLESLTDKDLTDVPLAVLDNHFNNCPSDTGSFYGLYVLSPRIDIEHLMPWREYLATQLAPVAEVCRDNPDKWVKWIGDSIALLPDWVPSAAIMNPGAAYRLRQANARSRDVLFVAGARAMGIPARIDPVTGATQWADTRQRWHTVSWEDSERDLLPSGTLQLAPDDSNRVADPAYYTHFSISRIEGGEPRQLEFPEDATMQGYFSRPVELEAGQYLLTTGQRLADGTVLARSVFFTIEPDTKTNVALTVRHDDTALQVIGSHNSENLFTPVDRRGDALPEQSLLATTGRGYYILGIIAPGQEPTNHALRDIADVDTGLPMVLLLRDGADAGAFVSDPLLPDLSGIATLGVDTGGINERELRQALGLRHGDLPVFVVADTFNRVVFSTQGYTIGLGHTLQQVASKLKQ